MTHFVGTDDLKTDDPYVQQELINAFKHLIEATDCDGFRRQLIRREANAKQRDRFRVVELAVRGEPCPVIMRMLGRSRGFVQRWAYAYRDGGLDAIAVKPQPGRPTILPADRHEAFRQRVLAGPTEDDGVTVLRGQDMLGILEREFGVSYSLGGLYDLLHRLNLSVLVPRPQHRKSDPEAMDRWVDRAPFLSRK